ncbi:GTP pyrophosphokinase [Fundidesulfovibrio magnetotacticus]|uniref:GTP pyrophosphokinase n=1 Tax=Fundidesulfovibrio magnetotacticus TaxID=2730080 RepID=A0A6V8M0G1_9BACT|nr:bifunctional (p)ppGpp synthetase/guanosine-3',5'-bis(diphosphate) 3'-pyrophosphohydrolase [Fundidesulfovibrio magnetotacticus]GFK95516.1 GTP pyrophosphokinase [Fundidesulfovibrio magnetotacticus]
MIRINEIMDKVAPYMDQAGQDLITKAYVYSAAAHAGQTRLSGEPYLSHPLEVANILAEMRLDAASVSAGLLHDTVEDTYATVDEIEEQFGEEVADVVDGVTKISLMSFETKEEAQAENIRKMVLAMAEDIRVILVKLADRLHNMRTLDFQKPLKRQLISQETMDIYAPLANRLGLHRIKVELEDLSFKHLKPDIYEQLKKGVDEHEVLDQGYIDKVISVIRGLMEENAIKGRVLGRKKHLWSVHNKMKAQGLDLDQVHDIVAFRVIVSSLKDCYAVLGLVHSLWKPVHGRFKDYISMPKANMYQSLHTTVIGPDGERIEIQIRTEEMNQLAEYGVAAHWAYKERGKAGKMAARDAERFTWLRHIMDWQREATDSKEFMQTLRFDLFQEEVYIFTPKGDVKEMPEGATPVDFAYAIHTEVGSHCTGAKVNGRLVPLSTPLKNGDTVEIITDKNRKPSKDWLKFVKTAKARTRIKHWVKTQERAEAIVLGKEVLEKEGRKLGVNVQRLVKEDALGPVLAEYNFGGVDDLYVAVGYSKLTPRRVLRSFLPKPETPAKPESAPEQSQAEPGKGKPGEGIRIKGVDNVLVSYAGCCNPLPGEPVVGYISRGRGVIVHTHDCPNLMRLEPERLMQVSWEGEEDKPYPAKISILAHNRKGVLAKISAVLCDDGVNIDSGTFNSKVDGRTEIVMTVEVKDSSHLYRALDHLRKIADVVEVKRMVEESMV